VTKKQGAVDNMRAEETLRAILEHSYDGIFVTDGDGVVMHMNKACERIEETSADAIVGRRMDELVREGLYSESVSVQVIKEGRPVTLLQKTGTGKEVMVTGTPVFKDGRLTMVITNERDVTELNRLKRQVREHGDIARKYEEELKLLRAKNVNMGGIVTRSRVMQTLLQTARRVAQVETSVLITGESGTGKELLAKMIHRNSQRREGPFIEINCGALPETLFESELFGYEAGAFTGASKTGKPGLVELAIGGTIFFDEVGELSLGMQVKLLRFLQERVIVRVGGTKEIGVDVRIIAATNRNLQEGVDAGSFRSDLFYRLSVIPLSLPPLRQRREDVEPLIYHFQDGFNKQYEMRKNFSPEAVKLLSAYEWPGNVRELENLVERLLVTTTDHVIEPRHLGGYLFEADRLPLETDGPEPGTLKDAVEQFEKRFLGEVMKSFTGTAEMAQALGVDRSTIVRKLRRYGLRISETKS